LEYVAILDSYS